jgi:hypothetical protein
MSLCLMKHAADFIRKAANIHRHSADKTLEDAGKGAAIGGTLGAIIAGIAAIGTSVVLPGLGLVVAGPLAAALMGAGAGGLTGGLIGALVGHGIPEEHAAEYESGIKNGGVFMGVNARNDEDAQYFHNEFSRSGGSHVVGTGLGVAAERLTGAAIGSAVPGRRNRSRRRSSAESPVEQPVTKQPKR